MWGAWMGSVRSMSFVVACVAAVVGISELTLATGVPDTRVTIDTGAVQGELQGDVISFKGIPFALPPTGALRWKPPQPAAKWTGVRNASAYGADCMQIPFPSDAAPLGVKPAEDCLYLNVWRPAYASGKKLAVFVWIYGGGFVNGGSSPAVYDGTPFARDGVIFVSFNYRLGRFGFFAHPALSAEQSGGPLANYAIMDQIAALQWIRRNIGAFGGDPDKVTVCGESAGGMSVHVLLTSPAAHGLFQRAIIQSGGGRANLLQGRALQGGTDSAASRGVAFAQQVGIEGTGPEAMQKLRALPAEALLANLNLATLEGPAAATYVGGPVLDGKIMPELPSTLYAAGKQARVPLMVGANSLDISREHASADELMGEPARYVARQWAAQGVPSYEYRFSYVAESLRKQFPGATHASDIPFAFDTVLTKYGKDLTEQDAAAARAMHAYWVAFARTGKPQVAGQPVWPTYNPQVDTIMDFTNSGPVVGPDPWRARLDVAERSNEADAAVPR